MFGRRQNNRPEFSGWPHPSINRAYRITYVPPRKLALSSNKLSVLIFTLALIALQTAHGQSINTIARPDSSGQDVGFYSSMKLDANGYPVVAYVSDIVFSGLGLRILHCGDAFCTSGNSIAAIENANAAANDIGELSLQLDANGFPVVAYAKTYSNVIKVLHCNDANCSGGDDSIQEVGVIKPFWGLSMVLDGAGNPVISYQAQDGNPNRLALLHCDDPNCSPDAGGTQQTSVFVDTNMSNGGYSSLQLDANGYPVIAYQGLNDLRVAHCNDPNCAGNNESIQTPVVASPSYQTLITSRLSMVLDAAGNPVVAYQDPIRGGFRILHCNDSNCAGNNESVAVADADGGKGFSLQLVNGGFPVSSYVQTSTILKGLTVTRCNDANCTGYNERKEKPDTNGINLIGNTSMELDADGYPVISYYDSTLKTLKVMRCGDAYCSASVQTVVIDIEPDDPNNLINPAIQEDFAVTVAVLGQSNFNATLIEPATLRLGAYRGGSDSTAKPADSAGVISDINADGYQDFTIRFPLFGIGLDCGAYQLTRWLKGNLITGAAFLGNDLVTNSGPCEIYMDVDPFSSTNVVHPHHPDDLINVALSQPYSPSLLQLGPSRAVALDYGVPLDRDSNGFPDDADYNGVPDYYVFRFLTGQTGITCSSTDIQLVRLPGDGINDFGEQISDYGSYAAASITPDCDAGCH
jgi:hypothetical protein